MEQIRVCKFGGTSVATVDKIQEIARFLATQKQKLVIVVSAMNKMTDELFVLAGQVAQTPSKREMDMLLTTGEQQTAALLAIALLAIGKKAISLTGYQIGIETEGIHTKSTITNISTTRIKRHLDQNQIVIVAGFQGINSSGDLTTLGRGGSDTSAVALASALDAKCEIYTDVEGIYTLDPRIFPEAKKLSHITYDEMMELAILGASVLETRAVELAKKYVIPLYVGKTLSNLPGTWIGEKAMEKKVVTGIGIDKNVLRVSISGMEMTITNIADLFELFEKQAVNVDMISQNADKSLAFTCKRDEQREVEKAITDLKHHNAGVHTNILTDVAKISLVGIGMMSSTGTAAKVFRLLANSQIEVLQVSTSDISISVIISEQAVEQAVIQLAQAFDL
ncbi:lysine-sensitive aspartokinase 3 [Erysipelotrichaceae bacterium]|nr:lysine-sensitive aspartokinase 3 [Erysipelotrichaceae bacterium]